MYDTDAAFDISGTKTPWERFENKVAALRAADPSVDYKVLYIGRHGEGYHNAAETYYGTPAWNCYWSELDGNGTVVWADAQIVCPFISSHPWKLASNFEHVLTN